jgi:Protein of unknown function (DUF1549)
MSNRRSGLIVLGTLALGSLAPAAKAQDQAPDDLPDVEVLSSRIDHFLATRQKEKGVQPVPLTDDAEFIRRVYLDLAGCIPPLTDVRDFLDDNQLDKRRLWVDRLLDGKKPSSKPNAFRQHFANVWHATILASAELVERGVVRFALPMRVPSRSRRCLLESRVGGGGASWRAG